MGEPPRARHTFEEHTGEVRVGLEAPTLAALFEEAGRALAELVGEAGPESVAEEAVALEAADREALLVAWLDELIFRSETRGLVYRDLAVDELGERTLSARVRGAPALEPRTPVKAATLHGLAIERRGGGFSASVVLDV